MLEVEGLTTDIDGDSGVTRAVDALSLTIERGETFALVGESGCGKSMTALSILRLLPDSGRVSAGSVDIDGTDVTKLPEARMRDVRGRRASIIFQEPSTSLNPVMTVGRQIEEVIERHTSLRGAASRALAIEWLTRVGIPEPARRVDDYPFQMSGGQKQRVMIAIALAAEPEIVIADEPTTALDVTIQAQILALLKELQASQQMAMLLITHDLAIVSQMAHRVALMYAGQIVEVAEAKDFFAKPLHPYAANLFDAVPDSAKRGKRLASIPGTVPPLNQTFVGCRFADRCGKVMPRCRIAPPPLIPVSRTHAVRCILYERSVPSDPHWLVAGAAGAGIGRPARGRDTARSARLPRLVPDSQGIAEARRRAREGGRRRLVPHRDGPYARAGRRIGQRQDDGRERRCCSCCATRQKSAARCI
jgi:peptide/nickel transport system ATP-binding protein